MRIKAELMGLHSLSSFGRNSSSPRSVMFSSHFAQRLVTLKPESKICQTGAEKEFGKYTLNVKMPDDGVILRVIDRYPKTIGQDSIPFNPETLVIWEDEKTKTVDCFTIPYYSSFHQYFGFKYEPSEGYGMLKKGAYIPKDTVFVDVPGKGENNEYKYSVNLNTAYMTVPGVTEDGFVVSREVIEEKLKFRIYETRVVEFGAKEFPLNTYGTRQEYRIFPEIGEKIRSDGLLMMTREYDEDVAPVELGTYDTMEPDFMFDKGVYVRGGEGRVVDIEVISNNHPSRMTPTVMTPQVDKYRKALVRYYQNILDAVNEIRANRRKLYGEVKFKVGPALNRLIVEALAITNNRADKHKQNLDLFYRRSSLDEYRVRFVIEYVMTPTIGYKLTDTGHGGIV